MSDGGATPGDDANPNGDTIRADIEALKGELAKLMAHVKSGVSDGVAGEARHLLDAVAGENAEAAEALRRYVEARPLTALLIAFGCGFVASRLLKR